MSKKWESMVGQIRIYVTQVPGTTRPLQLPVQPPQEEEANRGVVRAIKTVQR